MSLVLDPVQYNEEQLLCYLAWVVGEFNGPNLFLKYKTSNVAVRFPKVWKGCGAFPLPHLFDTENTIEIVSWYNDKEYVVFRIYAPDIPYD